MKEVTGFLDISAIKDETSEKVARTAFQKHFVPHSLPRLVIMDYGSNFKVVVTSLCKIFYIT